MDEWLLFTTGAPPSVTSLDRLERPLDSLFGLTDVLLAETGDAAAASILVRFFLGRKRFASSQLNANVSNMLTRVPRSEWLSRCGAERECLATDWFLHVTRRQNIGQRSRPFVGFRSRFFVMTSLDKTLCGSLSSSDSSSSMPKSD